MEKKDHSQRESFKPASEDIFSKVNGICALVNSVKDGDSLLKLSLEKVLDLLGAKRGSVFILSDNNELVLNCAQGLSESDESQRIKKIGQGIVGLVAEKKEPISVDNIETDERFANYHARKSYDTPSFLCVPFLFKDQLIGVMNIADKASGKEFSGEELQLLDFIGSQIAVNYRRIQLYQKFKQAVKRSYELEDQLDKTTEERARLQKQVLAHEKLASLGKLAGGIAHEFNNPLDGVIRYTNLCLMHASDDEVLHGYLSEIKNGLNRMADIVRSLLACSRGEEGGGPVRYIQPVKLIEQSLQAVRAEAMQKNVSLFSHVDHDLSEFEDLGAERITVNLLRNAIDAVGTGGSVKISALREDNMLVISVEDNGAGVEVPEGKIDAVFDPFYTTKDIDKGCGLGLTIVSEIVKGYGGRIEVETKKGEGSIFKVFLPFN